MKSIGRAGLLPSVTAGQALDTAVVVQVLSALPAPSLQLFPSASARAVGGRNTSVAVQHSPREGWSAEEPSSMVQVICAKISVSRHRHLHLSLLIDLTHLIVCMLMGASLSKAPDSEVNRCYQSGRAEFSKGCSGVWSTRPFFHPLIFAPFSSPTHPRGAAAGFTCSQKGRQADSCHAVNQIVNCGLEGKF